MVRNRTVFKKRKNVGKPSIVDPGTPTPGNSSNVPVAPVTASASKKKLAKNESCYKELQQKEPSCNSNILLDISLLSEALEKFAACKKCGENISLETKCRAEIVHEIQLRCQLCDNKLNFNSSKKVKTSTATLYENNVRLVFALRTIGKGRAAGETFCGIMNVTPPPEKFSTY
ncbi:hypothetical protein JTE90_009654 [Oedothorax gibbosus]|uniref:Mutator-like transposase domain-containing protein n=1 Tax=Oedothorax gibbosus TaxID=931172 RepID=A0AAV6TVJ1_9ARAC|nr:hypothetical protein JTE90_009654 [Oedothorax gibbosus]